MLFRELHICVIVLFHLEWNS